MSTIQARGTFLLSIPQVWKGTPSRMLMPWEQAPRPLGHSPTTVPFAPGEKGATFQLERGGMTSEASHQ